MKTLVIGLGIGRLYADTLIKLGHTVFTVDPDPAKHATFTNLDTALNAHAILDVAFICTPNHTHDSLAQVIAKHAKLVLIEKPGVQNIQRWKNLHFAYANTKFSIIKNNMWREWDEEFRLRTQAADMIHINCKHGNIVNDLPSWYTNKKLSFGGSSMSLMPDLLSLFLSLHPNDYTKFTVSKNTKMQRFSSKDFTNKEIYNVDDWSQITLTDGVKTYELTADWRSDQKDDIAIHCYQRGELIKSFKLEKFSLSSYEKMIANNLSYIENNVFWNNQLNYDLWIQERITA